MFASLTAGLIKKTQNDNNFNEWHIGLLEERIIKELLSLPEHVKRITQEVLILPEHVKRITQELLILPEHVKRIIQELLIFPEHVKRITQELLSLNLLKHMSSPQFFVLLDL